LQSGDVRIPEVSIVLAESSSLPAWSSNGLTVGPLFFVAANGGYEAVQKIDGYIRDFIKAAT
jgi:hypothetical protein